MRTSLRPWPRWRRYQYLQEWEARLYAGLGQYADAQVSLVVAEDVVRGGAGMPASQSASDGAAPVVEVITPAVFRMRVMAAEVATSALELDRAEQVLHDLRGNGAPLGRVIADRVHPIIAWLGRLSFDVRPAPNLALLRAEAALTIVGLWFERGKYRAALRLMEAIEPDLPAAAGAVRTDQVRLLEIELRLEAGDLVRAKARLEALPPGETVPDRVRQALVRARLGLVSGDLAMARACLTDLEAAPAGEPSLFASAAAARVAILVELNLWQLADEVAGEAIARLGDGPGVAAGVALLAQTQVIARARGQSVMAVWELPVATAAAQRAAAEGPTCMLASPEVGAGTRLSATWSGLANQVLASLERDDLEAAAHHQANLEDVARDIESDLVAARVRLSAAMLAYACGPTPALVGELRAIADRLHDMSARGAEAQATRYAAWAAATLGRLDEYVGLARRSAQIIDEIAEALTPTDRALYLLNKWSGRDEVVAAKLRELLEGRTQRSRRAQRRATCDAFREIAVLSHWPVDHAFGERDADQLLGATADVAGTWVRAQLTLPDRGRRRGFTVRSPRSLWRVPARTLILHYHVLADRSYVFRIAPRHIDLVVLPVGRLQLRADMRAVLASAPDREALAEHTGVVDALRRFPRTRHLIIVPHDAMANVPFAALPVDGKSLCERVAISQIDRLDRLRPRRWRRRSGPCVGIGLASYAGVAPDLPAAEYEATLVAEATGGQALVDHAATCEGVLGALRDARRVHIAAHGHFDDLDPGGSGILLRDGAGIRTLTLRELRGVDASGVDLATLAVCQSAESAVLPGGTRICLPSALLDAGVRGVIAALWPIEDEPSVAVIGALYRHLATAPPAVALARTQVELQDRPLTDWAGLVFYGSE